MASLRDPGAWFGRQSTPSRALRSAQPTLASRAARASSGAGYREPEMRPGLAAVMDRDARRPRNGGDDLGFPGLQISRHVRRKGRRDLRADSMAAGEADAGHERRQAQLVDPARLERLRARAGIAIAGANHVVAGAHEVHGASVGIDVLQPDPQIKVAAVAGRMDHGADRAGDLQILRERLGIEREHILARLEPPVIVRAVLAVRIHDRLERVGNERRLRRRPRSLPESENAPAVVGTVKVERHGPGVRRRPARGGLPFVGAHHEVAYYRHRCIVVTYAPQVMIEEVENDIVIVDGGRGSEVELSDFSLAGGSHAVYPRTEDQVRPGLAGRSPRLDQTVEVRRGPFWTVALVVPAAQVQNRSRDPGVASSQLSPVPPRILRRMRKPLEIERCFLPQPGEISER